MRLLLALAMLLSPAVAAAQGPRYGISYLPENEEVARETTAVRPVDVGGLSLAGVLGAGVGILGGGIVGAGVERLVSSNCYDLCGLAGGVTGAAIGSTLAIPMAVHMANGRRGKLSSSLAWSGFAAAVGWGLGLTLHDPSPVVLVPIAQIIISVSIESRAGRTPR